MHSDYSAIEQAILGQQRQAQLPGLVQVLQRSALRMLDRQDDASQGLKQQAVREVREDLKIAFLNLELQTQKQPQALADTLQDMTKLQEFGFSKAQSLVLARAAQDLLDFGTISDRPVRLMDSALEKRIATVTAELTPPAPAVTTPAVAVVPADIPVMQEVVAEPVAAQGVDKPTRLGEFTQALKSLRIDLGQQIFDAQAQGQSTGTVATALGNAFEKLRNTANLEEIVQDKDKLETLGFTGTQAFSLARSAKKFFSGEEETFNVTRVKAALKVDLAYANQAPAVVAAAVTPAAAPAPVVTPVAPAEPEALAGPVLERPRMTKLVRALVTGYRETLTETTDVVRELKTQVEQGFGALLRRARGADKGLYNRLAGLLRDETALEQAGFTPAQSGAIARVSQTYLSNPGSEPDTSEFKAVLRSEVAANSVIKAVSQSTQVSFMQRLRGLGQKAVTAVQNTNVMQRAMAASTVLMAAGLMAMSSTVPDFLKNGQPEASAAPAPITATAKVAPAEAAAPVQVAAPRATTAVGVLNATVGTKVDAAVPAPVMVPAVAPANVPAAAPAEVAPAKAKAEPVVLKAPAPVAAQPVALKTQAKPAPVKVSFNQQIATIQTQLMGMGEAYKVLQKDGVTGTPSQQFANALSHFQFSNGLPKTGKPNPQTLEKLAILRVGTLTAGL